MASFVWQSSLENLKIDINTLTSKIGLTNSSIDALAAVVSAQGDFAIENCKELSAYVKTATDGLEKALSAVNDALMCMKPFNPPQMLPASVQRLAIENSSVLAEAAPLQIRSNQLTSVIRPPSSNTWSTTTDDQIPVANDNLATLVTKISALTSGNEVLVESRPGNRSAVIEDTGSCMTPVLQSSPKSEQPVSQLTDKSEDLSASENQPATTRPRFQALKQKAGKQHQQEQRTTDDFSTPLPHLSSRSPVLATDAENSYPTGNYINPTEVTTAGDVQVNDHKIALRHDAAEFVPCARSVSVSSHSSLQERRQSTIEVLQGARDAVEKICKDFPGRTPQASEEYACDNEESGCTQNSIHGQIDGEVISQALQTPLPDDAHEESSDFDLDSRDHSQLNGKQCSMSKKGGDAENGTGAEHLPAVGTGLASASSSRRSSFTSREVDGLIPKGVFEVRKPPLWQYVLAEVTHVDRERRKVYIVLREDNDLSKEMLDEIRRAHREAEPSDDSFCPRSTIVIAPYDGDFYRARFDGYVDDNFADVYFLDFGNTERVPREEIRLLTPGRGTRNALKTCQLAIPCEFEDRLYESQVLDGLEAAIGVELVQILLTSSRQDAHDTVYMIKDIVYDEEPASFISIATERPLKIDGAIYRVSHASDPHNVWIINSESLEERQAIESEIHNLPSLRCSEVMSFEKGHYTTLHRKRAQVTKVDGAHVDLYMIDYGTSVPNVRITKCRRPPLIAFLTPPLASRVSLASCDFDRESWTDKKVAELQNLLADGEFRLRVLDETQLHQVFLINKSNDKQVVKDLVLKGLCYLKAKD